VFILITRPVRKHPSYANAEGSFTESHAEQDETNPRFMLVIVLVQGHILILLSTRYQICSFSFEHKV
jgi:hypothetical protein